MLCSVAAVKRFPEYQQSADYIFWSFWVIDSFRVILIHVIEFCLSRYFSTGHEKTQLNRV